MSDLIERQAAIDAIRASRMIYSGTWGKGLAMAEERLRELPSAQPAPCEFCKHNNIADDKACLMCSAERREDGE